MAKSLNKVMLIGFLGRDPEIKYMSSGKPICNFSIATGESWKDKEGNQQEKTEWHRIVAFGKLAEIAGEYLSKGAKVYLEGKLQTRSWDDKDGGAKRYTTEVVLSEMLFLSGKGGSGSSSGGGDYEPPPHNEEDVPF